MMDRKIVSLTILLAALSGCSDPKKANEENFEKSAQTYLDTQYPQCFVVTEFPTETKDFEITGNNKALHALAQVGIIKEVELSRKEIPKSLWQEQRPTFVTRSI